MRKPWWTEVGGQVVSGTIVLGIAGVLTWRNWERAKELGHSLWRWVQAPVSLPQGVVHLWLVLSAGTLLGLLVYHLHKTNRPWLAWTEREYFGMLCHWEWPRFGDKPKLTMFTCLTCKLELTPAERVNYDGERYFVYKCTQCGEPADVEVGSPEITQREVLKRIRRDQREGNYPKAPLPPRRRHLGA